MKRAFAIACVVMIAVPVMTTCSRSQRDIRPDEAAAGLRAEPGFTSREHSSVGRELVQVVAIRRIGRVSCEVEFTWKNTAPPAGQLVAPLRTSMALFRLQEDGRWRLTSLFRVD